MRYYLNSSRNYLFAKYCIIDMLKKIILFCSFIMIVFLSWCWQNNYLTVDFYTYKFQLSDDSKDWVSVSPSILWEKQIVKKIEKIYKKKKGNINVIISKVYIKNKHISPEEFVMANVEKFKDLIGYSQIYVNVDNFECKGKDIKLWIHKFKIDQSFLWEKKPVYYVGQFYLYDWKYWYIIQVLWWKEDEVDKYINEIKDSLSCK